MRVFGFIVFFLLWVGTYPTVIFHSPVAGAQEEEEFDEPDLNHEARLYNIYINYHRQSTPLEQWSVIMGDRESEVYSIQRGDTLWGISSAFFNDGHFWPKIWSLNSRINNPHLIEPGNQIRFLLGNESDAPAFAVTGGGEEEGVAEVKSAPEGPGSQVGLEDIEIPPPENVSPSVIRKIPPSLPEWQNDNQLGTYDELGISMEKHPALYAQTHMMLLNYVSEESPESLGKICEIETGGIAAIEQQYVYVQVKKGGAQTGDQFLVVQEEPLLQRSSDLIEELKNYGRGIEVQGVVSLSNSVASNDKDLSKEYDLFRALVLKAYNPIRLGAKLVKDTVEKVSMEVSGPRSSVVAQIYGGTKDPRRLIFTAQSIAYLNRGSENGLKPGQILPIRSNRSMRVEGSIVNETLRPIGWLKVVKVTSHLATAVILKAFGEIRAGDLTGQEDLMALPGATEDDLDTDAFDELEDGEELEDDSALDMDMDMDEMEDDLDLEL